MKSNSKQTPNVTQDIIAKANLQSRDFTSG